MSPEEFITFSNLVLNYISNRNTVIIFDIVNYFKSCIITRSDVKSVLLWLKASGKISIIDTLVIVK